MKIPKLKIKRIKEFLKKLPQTLGEKAFLVFFVLLFLALFLCGVIFYRYHILVTKAGPKTTEKPPQFKEKAYQEILKIWQEKEKKFQATDLKEYPNPFQPIE